MSRATKRRTMARLRDALEDQRGMAGVWEEERASAIALIDTFYPMLAEAVPGGAAALEAALPSGLEERALALELLAGWQMTRVPPSRLARAGYGDGADLLLTAADLARLDTLVAPPEGETHHDD